MPEKNNIKELNLISVGTIVEGKIRTQGSLRVDGKVVGEVHVGENFAVGSTGEIEGTINARNLVVGGKIKGNVVVGDKIVLEGKSTVRGDIRAARLVIDEGAVYDGKISMVETKPNEIHK